MSSGGRGGDPEQQWSSREDRPQPHGPKGRDASSTDVRCGRKSGRYSRLARFLWRSGSRARRCCATTTPIERHDNDFSPTFDGTDKAPRSTAFRFGDRSRQSIGIIHAIASRATALTSGELANHLLQLGDAAREIVDRLRLRGRAGGRARGVPSGRTRTTRPGDADHRRVIRERDGPPPIRRRSSRYRRY